MDAFIKNAHSSTLEELEKEPSLVEELGSDNDDGGDDDISKTTGVPSPNPVTTPRHNGRQTGPKGVIADHAYYNRLQSQVKATQIRAHNENVAARAPTTTTYREDEARRRQDELLIQKLDEEDDKEALRHYRETRMKEMRRLGGQGKKFGTLVEINADQYASAIDSEYNTVAVVIHIFDNSVPQCRLLNDHLAHLARKYAAAKFLRIQAHDLSFDVVGLPALLAYKGGVLVANLVRVTEQIGETGFDADRVEDVLLKSGALTEDDIVDFPPAFNSTRSDSDDD